MGCCFSKNKIQDIDNKIIVKELNKNNEKSQQKDNSVESNEDLTKELPINKKETVNKINQFNHPNDKNNNLIVEEYIDEINEEKSTTEYNLEDWQKILNHLKDNSSLINFALDLKRTNFMSINDLAKEFLKFKFDNDFEKAWLIYVWITHNIEYDKKYFGIAEANEAITVLITGKCVCEGYSNLFYDLCQRLRIECIKVSGYAKGSGYKLGKEIDEKENGHAWNAIRIDSKWYYVDTTWGASGVKINDQNEAIRNEYNPNYFLTPPNFLIYTHWSQNFQLQKENILLKSFEDMMNVNINYHLFKLNCLSHKSSIINASHNPVFIEFKAPKNIYLTAELENESNQKLDNLVLIQKDSNKLKIGIIVYLPEIYRNYILKIFTGKVSEDIQLTPVYCADFLIRRESNELINFQSDYNMSYLYDINCLSHKSSIIRSVNNPEFIEFSVPRHVEMIFSIAQHNGKELNTISNDKLIIQRDSTSFNYGIFMLNLKLNTFYLVQLFAKPCTNNDSNKKYKKIGALMIFKQADNLNLKIPNYSLCFDYGLKCLSHGSSIIKSNNNPLFLELSAPKQTLIIANLFTQNSNGLFDTKINDSIIIQRDSKTLNYGLFVFIKEKNKNYKLQVYAKHADLDTTYLSVDHFFLVSRIKDEINNCFPSYSIEFKYGLKLLSHSSSVISTFNKILFLEFSALPDINIICELKKKNSIDEFVKLNRENNILIQQDKNSLKFGIFVIIPTQFEFFKFSLFANYISNLSKSYDYAGELLVLRNGDALDFNSFPKYNLEFDYGLKCLSHFSQVIESKSNCEKLIFYASRTTQLLVNLYDVNDNKLDHRVLVQRDYIDLDNFEIKVSIPKKENFYYLKVFANDEANFSDSYQLITSFLLYLNNTDNIDENGDLSYVTVYSNKNIKSYILNPINKHLKLNTTYEFKIYVENAVQVCLHYKNEWFNFLKDDDSTWFIIKTFEILGEVSVYAKSDPTNKFLSEICRYVVSN